MATTLKTREISGIELLDVGKWDASTGPIDLTDEFLDELVDNTNELIELGVLSPPGKLGHPKGQKLLQEQGWPAAGWVKNLYRKGTKVLGDVEGVPEKLADLIEAGGYKKMSCEFWTTFGKVGGKGKKYGPALTAISFLGEEIPAVSTLDDVFALFGMGAQPAIITLSGQGTPVRLEKKTVPDDVEEDLVAAAESFAEKAAEKTKGKVGAPRLRAFLDEVRRRVRELLEKQEAALGDDESLQERTRKISDAVTKRYGYSAWVSETYDTYVIVDREGKYFQLEYSMAENGDVTLGVETEVQRSWKVKAAAVKHTFDVGGGEPEWKDVDTAALPAAAYAVVGDEDKESTWQLPHHHLIDGKLLAHAGGIRAALKAKDIPKAARAHLEEHARRAEIGEPEKEEADMANKDLAKLFGLPEDADDAAIQAKAKELVDGQAKLSATEATVLELKAREETRTATERVETAIRARKVPPAEKDFWVAFAKDKPKEFDELVQKRPVLFSAPIGTEQDAPEAAATEQLNKLANERIAEAQKKGVKLSFREALLQVSGEQPELARQNLAERRAVAPRVASAS
jgi:Mu-like prophage I protein